MAGMAAGGEVRAGPPAANIGLVMVVLKDLVLIHLH